MSIPDNLTGSQVADMIAYESRSLMVQRQTNKDAPPSELYKALTKRGLHQPKFWTTEYLDQAAAMNTPLDKKNTVP
jgi:hypothetical protein